MFKSLFRIFILAISMLLFQTASAAGVTVHEVYQAAESGHVREALSMMDKVLSEHPTSAQAHYVEAELLARVGELDKARGEFSKARELNPALSFAKPTAVQGLQEKLYGSNALETDRSPARGFPWGATIMVGLLVLSAVLFVRSLRQRAAAQSAAFGNLPPATNYGPGYGPAYPPSSGGLGGGSLGGGILGGLATGAAIGAGMVAGEALASRIMDGGEHHQSANDHASNHIEPDVNQDMGGNDFGLNDSSSWDDGGGSFGGDIGGGDWS